jgi:hypothetical protein
LCTEVWTVFLVLCVALASKFQRMILVHWWVLAKELRQSRSTVLLVGSALGSCLLRVSIKTINWVISNFKDEISSPFFVNVVIH